MSGIFNAIAIGKSGTAYPVARVEGNRLVLATPKGAIRVPRSAIARLEIPASPHHWMPVPGQRVAELETSQSATVNRIDPDGSIVLYATQSQDAIAGRFYASELRPAVEDAP
ncbi:MAG: hypothetical protein KME35_17900 [Aphanocapsa sp. GSE-SYN-MK-11-07L]|jgi:hypothetical protein|nr:hypothetical protein [Aphanocapsa sp. GSE-SYN-MK-11-07L]